MLAVAMSNEDMNFDLNEVPFSRRGSWLAFSILSAEQTKARGMKPGLYLRTMQGAISGGREVFHLEALGKSRVKKFKTVASPHLLRLETDGGRVEMVFVTPERLRLRGQGMGLALEAGTTCYATLRPAGLDRWEANLMAQRIQLMLSRINGRVRTVAPWEGVACRRVRFEILPGEDGFWEIEIEEFFTAWKPAASRPLFEKAVKKVKGDFAAWLEKTPRLKPEFEPRRKLAAYIQWMSLVSPRGYFRREAMLMSKNWMTNVWSWDHCFNAIGLVASQPELAWDQWALMFDFQNEAGALPDCVNNADMVWNFCKPPVHGWALREMRKRGLRLSRAQLQDACVWLENWTEWWMVFRDEDGDGLPQYNHGNDSGWDNASCFALGMPVEGVDLAAFLVVQMETVADLHEEFYRPVQAADWRERAAELHLRLNAHSWRGTHFLSPRSGDHRVAKGDSLVNFMPLVLGRSLLPKQRRYLIQGLRRFITPYGLATENPLSSFYREDGYWLGPVWAPSTRLIIAGLRDFGRAKLAADLADRFGRACLKGGMAENFNALTGEGLRDRAYTWTASVFLELTASSGKTVKPS